MICVNTVLLRLCRIMPDSLLVHGDSIQAVVFGWKLMLTGVLGAICQNTVGSTVSLSCLKQAESSEYLVELSLSSLEHALLASHLPLQLLHTHQLPLCFLLSTLFTSSSASHTHAMSGCAASQLEHQQNNTLCQATL